MADDHNDTVTNDHDEADRRFKRHKFIDPLPTVHLALLNKQQITDYVRNTAMVLPFEPKKLKIASYEVPFLGDIYEMNGDGTPPKVTKIEEGTHYVLRHNSIAFLRLETELRLPTYIAVRFNLQIKHVHRGILLGTGPLIDPGFKGRILIPLHNLTANDYLLVGGEGFIWMEFTKLAPLDQIEKCDGIPDDKTAEQYFAKATGGSVPRSSIPGAVLAAQNSAKKAEHYAKLLAGVGILGVLGFLSGLAVLVFNTWSLTSTVRKEVSDGDTKLGREIVDQKLEMERRLSSLQEEIEHLNPSTSQPKRGSTTQ